MSTTLRLHQTPLQETPLARDRCTLTVLAGPNEGAIFAMGSDGTSIGRGERATCVLDDPGVSSLHATLRFESGSFVLEDVGSTNGTFVNGILVQQSRALCDGDRIRLGQASLLGVAIHDASEQRVATQLYHAAICDPLTNLHNRGFFEDRLRAEFAFAARHGDPLSLLFLDLDHFTQVNNTWGHQAGDAVLQQAAMVMASSIRTEDLVARYGGEEFVLIARATALEPGLVLAERLRAAVAALAIPWDNGTIRITTSVGVACFDARRSPYADPAALVAGADKAVYRAKREGRNRVCAL